MAKIDLNNITSGFNLSKINDNFQKISAVINTKILFRDNPVGEPNQLVTDLDVNGKRVYNLLAPVEPHEPARKADLDAINNPSKLLRVGDVEIPEIAPAIARRNKVLVFDNQGNPIPSADIYTQLADLEARVSALEP